MKTPAISHYQYHRFPAEIISHGVRRYFRFCLNYRDIEALRFVRGVIVSYEVIRKWCRSLASRTPISCGVGVLCPVIYSTWMGCF